MPYVKDTKIPPFGTVQGNLADAFAKMQMGLRM